MQQTVTAIVVARAAGDHLERTLQALASSTRRPDSVIVIGRGDVQDAARAASRTLPVSYLEARDRLGFPAAIAAAARTLSPPRSGDEWLWLLSQDTAPEPAALERMLAVGETSPSVALAGPKLVEWDDRTRIRDFGVTMTRFGRAVPLVEGELDQAQHDGLSDVLGVASAGMLVRHAVWLQLGGLDQGLPVVDGGLDLSVRARLTGHRVVLAPTARVALGDDGVAAPKRTTFVGTTRQLVRQRRVAALHRRMAWAPAAALPFHWLSLVPLALLRSLLWLVAKRPQAIPDEFAAAVIVAFGGSPVGAIRRGIRQTKTVGWGVIAPLRLPLAELRRRQALQREALLMLSRGEKPDAAFFGGGGGWVALVALAVNVGMFLTLLGSSTVGGGGLLGLSPLPQLWQGVGWGWQEAGTGFWGAGDPFGAVLAVLGSITFWQPSFALVLLWLTAMPIAAIGAWLLASRVTPRHGLRAVLALAWAFSPVLLVDLQAGRPAAVILHLLLPFLGYAAWSARRSWAASGVTAILAAAAAACAPSLIPALALAWLVWLATSGRDALRIAGIPIPAVALFWPLVWQAAQSGNWLRILADPGPPTASAPATPWQLLLGDPAGGFLGWSQLAAAIGVPDRVVPIVLTALVAPLAVLALLGLFRGGSWRSAAGVLGALLGLATAAIAAHVVLETSGASPVALWTGPALSFMWLGLVVAATAGLDTLRRRATVPGWIAATCALIAILPLVAALPLGRSVVVPTAAGLPAYVQAAAQQQPRLATLAIDVQPDGAFAARLVHGGAATLDAQSTLAATAPPSADDAAIAQLTGNLVTTSGYDASAVLAQYGIRFVLVDEGAQPSDAALAAGRGAGAALDGNADFAQAAQTATGTLWAATQPVAPAPVPPQAGGLSRPLVLVVLGIVFGYALLLSLPTGGVVESDRRAQRRANRAAAAGANGGDSLEDEPIDDVFAPDAFADDDELVGIEGGF